MQKHTVCETGAGAVIPAFGRLKWGDREFKSSLGYIGELKMALEVWDFHIYVKLVS